jgi:hypothetical protein
MTSGMKVHLFCLCWNDARMLPFFIRHYDKFVDRYFIFDNGSTDNSLSLLRQHARVDIHHFDVKGDSFVDEERRLGDTIWKGSDAGWVIVTDIDEHVYHPRLLRYLQRCKEDGVTAIQSIGYEMVSDAFPTGTRPLVDTVTEGARSTGHDRLCIFNPQAITETNFTAGRHRAAPEGRVIWAEYPEVLLLHYKQLGPEYPTIRSAELRQGLKSRDLEKGWGMHYSWSASKIRRNWQRMKAMSGPVPGLGTLKHVQPEDYAIQERVVLNSGLVDLDWYVREYPDINPVELNPVLHFCIHGWREGRKPNFYFDPTWYSQKYPALSVAGQNPLFDYITRGEEADAWPSPCFNTPWYRKTYGLSQKDSPLRHYLKMRTSAQVSPLPEFDVEKYCANNPQLTNDGIDPFENYSKEDQHA